MSTQNNKTLDYFDSAEQLSLILDKNFPDIKFKTAVVLGSGLGLFTENLEKALKIPYSEIDGFPCSSAPGHEGALYAGFISGKPVICMSGRSHVYEGNDISRVVYPVRTLKISGVENLILTNAAGGINLDFSPGDLMLINDHINMLPNPLIGINDERLGPRFPDMTYIYKEAIRNMARQAAKSCGIKLKEGVYIGVTGPSYETPSEIKAFRSWGADAVGMSTVPEAIAANHCGMNVLGLSLITNMAAGILDKPLTGEEVVETAAAASKQFSSLLLEIIKKL